MSAEAFANSPEVKIAATHIYCAPVPFGAFAYCERPAPNEIFTLSVSASPQRVTVSYPTRQVGNQYEKGSWILFELDANSDDLFEQLAYLAWRELAGHTVPYAIYSPKQGGMMLKLSSDDERCTPRCDFRNPTWCI